MRRFIGLCVVAIVGCSTRPDGGPTPAPSASAAPGEGWLAEGSTDERFARVARHLRGFDLAMLEVGHRYRELYWAGQDQNWDAAAYQIDKIRTAVRNGVERRPKRAASAEMLEPALRGVEEATKAGDPAMFAQRFETLTATCNACHQAEKVPFFRARPPTVRLAPPEPAPGSGTAEP